ncbi:MAG: diphthamide biosynthesis enzyme Dph2 [Candidatus Thermoplasmatota archaeon]
MKIHGYRIDLKETCEKILDEGYKKIVLQIPEGLKTHVADFVDFIEEKTGSDVVISSESCFGACDLVDPSIKKIGVDAAIQIGHAPMSSLEEMSIPTFFVNAFSTLDVSDVTKKSLSFLEGKKIVLATTAQHIHKLDEVAEILKENSFQPVKKKGDKRIFYEGQILGCNFSSATNIEDDVDSFLYIGSGTFHPIGLKLATDKPMVSADPYTKQVKTKELEQMKESILRQRYGAISACRNAKKFGVLLGLKQGQHRQKLAYGIKKKIKEAGRKAYVVCMDNFSPDSLGGFRKIDCFVSTACPRIAIDDYSQYKKPLITPVELDIVLGLKEWDNYTFDQILE